MTLYSVLEQAPVRAGTPGGQSIRDALTFAQRIDGLGLTRLWIAEHHSMGGVASSAPEVLIGQVAAATAHLRIGSGAMLLPNHRPLHVAEQFLMLEALHPGRIDLGIGRSEGATDEAIVRAFGRPQDTGHGAGFDDQLDQLLAFGGVTALPAGHPLAGVRAGPPDVTLPSVYLLGSSPNSAETAARRGLATASPPTRTPTWPPMRCCFTASGSGPRARAIDRTRSSGSRWWSAPTTSMPVRWRCPGTSRWSATAPATRGR